MMKVLMLCDQRSEELGLKAVMEEFLSTHETESLVFDYSKVKPCVGCYRCWIKTPGICIHQEDKTNEVCAKIVNCDAVMILNEITYGGYSADIKAFLDRMIPNLSPYFEIIKKEMRHKRRYSRYPDWLTVGYGDSSEEEKRIYSELNYRNALNVRPKNYGALTVKDKAELKQAKDQVLSLLKEESR